LSFRGAITIGVFALMTNCEQQQVSPDASNIHDLDNSAKTVIKDAGQKFNALLTRKAIIDLQKEKLKNAPETEFLKNFESMFSKNDQIIMNAVLNSEFFKSVFTEDPKARTLTANDIPISVGVKDYMLKINDIIPKAIQNSQTTGGLEVDKKIVSDELIKSFNELEDKIRSDSELIKAEAISLLSNLEFHKLTIPTIINSLVAAEQTSDSGRVNWSWKKFWIVVGVVIVTAVAVAIIGAAVGAAWATIQGLSEVAITAASWAGLYWGASVGAVGGIIAGASGYCPDNWFKGGVPLIDWSNDC